MRSEREGSLPSLFFLSFGPCRISFLLGAIGDPGS
jgi:hypothetical protein